MLQHNIMRHLIFNMSITLNDILMIQRLDNLQFRRQIAHHVRMLPQKRLLDDFNGHESRFILDGYFTLVYFAGEAFTENFVRKYDHIIAYTSNSVHVPFLVNWYDLIT